MFAVDRFSHLLLVALSLHDLQEEYVLHSNANSFVSNFSEFFY